MRLVKGVFQDFARLLLHRAVMLCGANAELALGGFRKLADRYAGHEINDSIAIIDCTITSGADWRG